MTITKGRPASLFQPEYVSAIAQQVLVAFYNTHPDLLDQKFLANPNFDRTLPTRAVRIERMVRQVLTAHQQVPREYPENVADICFLVYVANLDGESPKLLAQSLKVNEHVYRERSEIYRGQIINILQAKTRVDRKDFLFLERPFVTHDEDEEF